MEEFGPTGEATYVWYKRDIIKSTMEPGGKNTEKIDTLALRMYSYCNFKMLSTKML